MSEKLKPPQKIYLQDYCEDYLSDGNTTWCDDKQNDDDIEYILRSECDALRAENERLKTALEKISLVYIDAYTDNHYHELKRVVNIAQQALKEVKE